MVRVNETKCSGCGQCVTMCPRGAISALGYAEVNSQKCTDCFTGMHVFATNEPLTDRQATLDRAHSYWIRKCVDYCPTGAMMVAEE